MRHLKNVQMLVFVLQFYVGEVVCELVCVRMLSLLDAMHSGAQLCGHNLVVFASMETIAYRSQSSRPVDCSS
jgi:hypothetical protein